MYDHYIVTIKTNNVVNQKKETRENKEKKSLYGDKDPFCRIT